MPELPDDCVALTVTSPPYWNAIDYDIHATNSEQYYRTRRYANGYRDYEEYLDWLTRIFQEVYRVTRREGSAPSSLVPSCLRVGCTLFL